MVILSERKRAEGSRAAAAGRLRLAPRGILRLRRPAPLIASRCLPAPAPRARECNSPLDCCMLRMTTWPGACRCWLGSGIGFSRQVLTIICHRAGSHPEARFPAVPTTRQNGEGRNRGRRARPNRPLRTADYRCFLPRAGGSGARKALVTARAPHPNQKWPKTRSNVQ